MAISFFTSPRLILEAEELVFSYVNGLSVRELTGNGPYCIPAPEIEGIMQVACSHLCPEDEVLRFYFQQFTLPGANGAATCLARLLIFTFSDWTQDDPEAVAQSILDGWKAMSSCHFTFTDISAFCLSSAPWESRDPVPFANGLAQLAMPMQLKERLLETLSDFGSHLEVLMGCLLPVANSLSHTLIPWAQKAEPLRRQWMLQMEALSPNQFVSQVLRANVPWEIQGVDAAIVYFVPGWLLPGVNQQNQHLKLLIGADRMPQRTCAEELEPWEYLAFRLLGNPARFQMLRALKQTPMTSREMAKNLELHLGAVSRDVSNMQDAGLLNIEFYNGRRRYSVNEQSLQILARHILDLCQESGEQT